MFRSHPLVSWISATEVAGSIPTRVRMSRIFDRVGDTPRLQLSRIGLKSPGGYPAVTHGGLSLLLLVCMFPSFLRMMMIAKDRRVPLCWCCASATKTRPLTFLLLLSFTFTSHFDLSYHNNSQGLINTRAFPSSATRNNPPGCFFNVTLLLMKMLTLDWPKFGTQDEDRIEIIPRTSSHRTEYSIQLSF